MARAERPARESVRERSQGVIAIALLFSVLCRQAQPRATFLGANSQRREKKKVSCPCQSAANPKSHRSENGNTPQFPPRAIAQGAITPLPCPFYSRLAEAKTPYVQNPAIPGGVCKTTGVERRNAYVSSVVARMPNFQAALIHIKNRSASNRLLVLIPDRWRPAVRAAGLHNINLTHFPNSQQDSTLHII